MNKQIFQIGGLLAFILMIFSGLFIVTQTQQAIVLQFGEFKAVHTSPGLKFKMPFIQEVIFYEKRILDYDTLPLTVTTSDENNATTTDDKGVVVKTTDDASNSGSKRLVVSAYTRYKIADPLLFFRSVKPSTELGAQQRLEPIVSSAIRNILGTVTMRQVLNQNRTSIMKAIQEKISSEAQALGITIVDVRIIRSELPPENRKAVFDRMNSELARYAKENRAKGEEHAQIIRSKADTERTILLAEAQREAQSLKAQGDTEAIKITNQAYGKDPGFFNFYKTLEVYKETIASSDTNIVMSTNSSIFSLLKNQPKH